MSDQCQSCAMPLSKDPNGGGSEADGSKSLKYCSHCYEAGAFKQPDITLDEMQALVVEKMKGMGFPRFLGRLYVKKLQGLERWR